jgi:hypothetical protein
MHSRFFDFILIANSNICLISTLFYYFLFFVWKQNYWWKIRIVWIEGEKDFGMLSTQMRRRRRWWNCWMEMEEKQNEREILREAQWKPFRNKERQYIDKPILGIRLCYSFSFCSKKTVSMKSKLLLYVWSFSLLGEALRKIVF